MLKLRIRQAGQPDLERRIAGDTVTVGRIPGCDVVIDQPYVSKRHLRIYRGIVVVDLGSSNGTWVDGVRIGEATLLGAREIDPGDGDVRISVEAEAGEHEGPADPQTTLPGGSDVERLRAECAALRREVAGKAELEEALRELRRKLEQTRLTPGHADATPASASFAVLEKQRMEIATLNERVASLESQLSAARVRPVPAPAVVPAPVPSGSGASAAMRALFADLAEHDFEARGAALDAATKDFLVVQQFRLVRHVERLVTRLAGDFIQIYNANTMLPDVEGNFRELVARCVDPLGDPTARRELVAYGEQLSRWLVASLGAHRQASARFADQLKLELSETALTESAPIPAFKRISGQAEAELWRRACARLRDMTADRVEERLEKLTREAALELLGERGGGAG